MRQGMFNNIPPAVRYLSGAIIFMFILQQVVPALEYFFILPKNLILYNTEIFAPWTLVTHMFLHGSFGHIFLNLYALILFGGLLESRIGTKRFLILFFTSGILAGFIASFFYNAALGASGAVMGVLGALILLMPNLRVLFFYAIPMPFWMAGVVWVLLDIFGIFFPSGVGNIAHLIGMGVGLLFGYTLIQKRKKYRTRVSKNRMHLSRSEAEEMIRNGRI